MNLKAEVIHVCVRLSVRNVRAEGQEGEAHMHTDVPTKQTAET